MVHVTHMVLTFSAVFNNLKSSFSEDNMPVHALEVVIENQNGLDYPIKTQKLRIKL